MTGLMTMNARRRRRRRPFMISHTSVLLRLFLSLFLLHSASCLAVSMTPRSQRSDVFPFSSLHRSDIFIQRRRHAPFDDSTTHQSGKATWYTQNGRAGSCGWRMNDEDLIVALPESMKPSRYCGRRMHIADKQRGTTVIVKVADTCVGCGESHVDLSRAAFAALNHGNFGQGVLDITYTII